MTLWRIAAAGFAVVMPVIMAVGYLRLRRRSYWVLVLQVFAVPEAAAIVYAADGDSEPAFNAWIWLAVGFMVVLYAFALGGGVAQRRLGSRPITMAELNRLNAIGAVNRTCAALALTALTFDFEPWFGVAGIVLNLVWALVWIPKALRLTHVEASTEIAAPAHDVFAFTTDPAKWPLYRSGAADLKLVQIVPPPPLGVGTKLFLLQSVQRGKALKPYTLKTTEVVTEMVTDRSFAAMVIERPASRSGSRLEPSAGGTTVNVWIDGMVSIGEGILGLAFDLPRLLAERRAGIERDLAKLKELLEPVTATQ